MAGAPLTNAQVLEAARRLPPGQRKSLVENLTAARSRLEALKVARRLRPAFRLSAKKKTACPFYWKRGMQANSMTHSQ